MKNVMSIKPISQSLLDGVRLNDKQIEAIQTVYGAVQVNAGAGSGKTAVLTRRTGHMILDHGINPSKIMLTTFTKKATNEMKDRLSGMIPKKALDKLVCGSFHSICYRILAREYENMDNPLAKAFKNPNEGVLKGGSDMKTKIFLNDVINSLLKDKFLSSNIAEQLKTLNLKAVLSVIGKAKNKGLSPEEYQQTLNGNITDRQWAYIEFYKRYEKLKLENNKIDFDDMLYLTYKLFKAFPAILSKYQQSIEYILIDEGQDNNGIQYWIAEQLAHPHNNIFLVGDDDQCQPEGSMVLTTEGYVDIKDLDENIHKLVSYDKTGSLVVGFKNGFSFKKAERHFKGLLYSVTAGNKVTKCTPNHKWIVKWNAKAKDSAHVVYMMQKENKFRVGWCKLFNSEGAFHLGVRARNEGAEKAWILKVTDNKSEASLWESFIATKYGLPLIPFNEVENAQHYTQSNLDTFFDMVSGFVPSRAIDCLNDLDLDINYPIYDKSEMFKRRNGNTIIEMHTCNLLDGLMTVPVHVNGKVVSWEDMSTSKELFEGIVYSLDVEKHELYIVDGLITHNCMYKFRGAEPEQFINFTQRYPSAKVIKLEDNYRCMEEILSHANTLIANNTVRLLKTLKPNKQTSDKSLFYNLYQDENEEGLEVATEVKVLSEQDGVPFKKMAILYRTNAQSRPLEDALIRLGIPYVIHGGISFYDRAEIKDIVAYLQLARDVNNNKAFERIYKTPLRGLGKAFLEKVQKVKGKSWFENMDQLSLTKYNEKQGVDNLRRIIYELQDMIRIKREMHSMVDYLMEAGYKKHLLNETSDNDGASDEGLEDNPRFDNIQQLKYLMSHFDNIDAFFDYVEQMINNKRTDIDGVQLMSIHRSKGLEFDSVFGVGWNDGLLPHYKTIEEAELQENPVILEEERRLGYVCITRAERKCYLSSTESYNGKWAITSRFIHEMGLEPDNLDQEETA